MQRLTILLAVLCLVALASDAAPLSAPPVHQHAPLPEHSAQNPDEAPPGLFTPHELTDVPLGELDDVTWSQLANAPLAVRYRTMGAAEPGPGGKFYVVGGQDANRFADGAEYDPADNTWSAIANMPQASANQAVVWWTDDGVGTDSSGLFRLGRWDGSPAKTSVHWIRATNTWAPIPDYPGAATEAGNMATVVGDSIFLMHRPAVGQILFSRYSIREGTWEARTPPPVVRWYGAACTYDGMTYWFGGWSNEQGFYSYDPTTGTWATLPSPPAGIVGGNSPHMAGMEGKIIIQGGGNGWTPFAGCVSYDIASGTWEIEDPLPYSPYLGAAYGAVHHAGAWGIHVSCGYTGSNTNTHFRGQVSPAFDDDVGVSAILAPTGTIEPGNVTPRVTVRNFGSVAQSNIPVYIVIDEGGTPVYSEDLTHPGPLDPGATVDVSFTPDWNATEGNYGVTSWTLLPGDENPANDTMRGTVRVSADNLVWYARTPAPAPARYWSPGHGAVRDTIYFLGGRQADAFSIRTIFAYDVANATWITSGLPNLLTPRRAGAGGRIGNKIYAAGGRDSAHTTLSTLEEFDVDAKTVVSRAAMPSAAWACFGAVAGDKLYVIGSETYAGITREYDPVGDAWATRATLAPGRGWAAAVGYDGKVYVTGGGGGGGVTLSDCWVFDPDANSWSPLANMPGPRIYHMMVADGEGSIYVLGGASDGAGSADQLVYRYDIVADAWSVETPMITARGWAMANVVGGSIWVAYGSDCSTPTYLLNLEEGVLPMVGMEEYRPVSVGGTALRVAGLVRDFATVRFNLARSGRARLNVYDISGKLVRTLASGVFEAGEHVATWDRTDDTGRLVANGTYFYRLTVEGRTVAAKSVVLN